MALATNSIQQIMPRGFNTFNYRIKPIHDNSKNPTIYRCIIALLNLVLFNIQSGLDEITTSDVI